MKNSYLGAILVAASSCLLGACGGGGASPMVRADTIPPPPPPPPASAPAEPCPPPVTKDCAVENAVDQQMTGGRQSDHALTVRGPSSLILSREGRNYGGGAIVEFRFGGGTTIESGVLSVRDNAHLRSNVVVQSNGSLGVGGMVTGNITNHGLLGLYGTIVGDVISDGLISPAAYNGNELTIPAAIKGNLRQTPDATLVAVMGAIAGGYVSVSGRADIAGTLQLVKYDDGFGPYPLPAAPFATHVLHADGGVFGQFAKWTSPGLFITGAIRYLANDVYFDASAISAAAAMAAAKADGLTVASAARFDTALGSASRSAEPDALRTPEQQRFLVAAGLIQRTRSFDQAIRTLDSLSGQGYAAANEALLQHASMPSADLMARMDAIHAGARLGAWSGQSATLASINGIFNGVRAGFDQWLGGSTVLGASLGSSDGSLRFDRAGGSARDRSPQWDVYAQHLFTDSTYVFGDIGYSQHRLDSGRSLDLGVGQFAVRGSRELRLLRTYLEGGQHVRIGDASLTLFGALSHAMLRGSGFVEQGITGFELAAQPSLQQRTSAIAGLRVGQAWRSGNRITGFSFGAGYQRALYTRDDLVASFAGAPDSTFALTAMPAPRGNAWMQFGLNTGNEHWSVALNYDRQASNDALSIATSVHF